MTLPCRQAGTLQVPQALYAEALRWVLGVVSGHMLALLTRHINQTRNEVADGLATNQWLVETLLVAAQCRKFSPGPARWPAAGVSRAFHADLTGWAPGERMARGLAGKARREVENIRAEYQENVHRLYEAVERAGPDGHTKVDLYAYEYRGLDGAVPDPARGRGRRVTVEGGQPYLDYTKIQLTPFEYTGARLGIFDKEMFEAAAKQAEDKAKTLAWVEANFPLTVELQRRPPNPKAKGVVPRGYVQDYDLRRL